MKALKDFIRNIPDFPKKGVLFRDITPLLSDPKIFNQTIRAFKKRLGGRVDAVVSIESRGFIFGSALAHLLGCGFVPVRKAGKLPCRCYRQSYDLEYGKASIEIHRDAFKKGARVIIVDDVLATGGTAAAAVRLVRSAGGRITGILFLIELAAFGGRRKLKGYPVESLITF